MKDIKIFWIGLFLVWFFISCGDGGSDAPIPKPEPEPSPKPAITIPDTELPQTQGTTYWWNEAVFYEIFVRSFYDSNGDGIGDINGIIEKLDYIQKDLGATALWLMPINPSPSYHGYDVTDYKAINPQYGTMQDFKNLVQQLHSRGMKIIIDLVLNHTSDEHPWFQSAFNDRKSIYRDWYVFSDTKPTWNGWHGNSTNGYYLGLFSHKMPDLNFETKALKDEVKSITKYWLQDMNVDGFRLDAVKHLIEDGAVQENTPATIAYWKEFSTNTKMQKHEAVNVAEIWSNSKEIAKYTRNGLDLGFEFDLSGSLLNAVQKGTPSGLKTKLSELRNVYPYHQYATFLSNHDKDRSYETMGKSIANSKLAAAVLLTLPGSPFIYYGEEIGMWGTKSGDDKWVRTPLHWTSDAATAGFTTANPWNQIVGDQETKNIATQKADVNSLLNTYRQFSTLRKKYPQLTKGTYQTLGVSSSSLFGYLRETAGKAIVVVHNFADNAISLPKIYAKKTNLSKGTYKVTDLISGTVLEDVDLNTDGGFLFKPVAKLESKRSKVLLLEKK